MDTKTVRLNITLPKGLVEAMNRLTEPRKHSRFIAEAVRQNIAQKEKEMIKISTTKLRNNLFEYLDKASEGETIVIQGNNQDMAHIVPIPQSDWRDKMSIKPDLIYWYLMKN